MKPILVLFAFLTAVSSASAGGDCVSGSISGFSGSEGVYTFHFEQLESRDALILRCLNFDVSVHYGRVPWYSWLPFVKSNHPTFEQTEAAAAFLRAAEHDHRPVQFCYMGGGLEPTVQRCTFQCKGLVLEGDPSDPLVISFHDPV